jgi:hypothetical protein
MYGWLTSGWTRRGRRVHGGGGVAKKEGLLPKSARQYVSDKLAATKKGNRGSGRDASTFDNRDSLSERKVKSPQPSE